MKRCPQCGREYDLSMSFCLDDGSELLYGPASMDEPQTAFLDTSQTPSEDATRRYGVTMGASSKQGATVDGSPSRPAWLRSSALLLLLALIALGGFLSYRYLRPASSGPINSIAVLPFQNRTGDPNSEYLSDGLAESLVYRLSQLPNLKVSPTSSVIRYKGKDSDIPKVASELGVDAVMTGRLAQIGDDLTISVELVDVRNNKSLWGEQYDRKMSDLMATQREIATAIYDKLQLKLTGDEAKSVTKPYTNNNEAYQLYLKGRYYWNKLTPEDMRRSIDLYQQAIDKDPGFALAYVGISDAYMLLGIPDVMLGSLPPQECIQKAKAAADKALQIDPALGEAYASQAHVKWKMFDWAGADADFRHSLELTPNYPNVHRFYAIYLACMGRRDEALNEAKRA